MEVTGSPGCNCCPGSPPQGWTLSGRDCPTVLCAKAWMLEVFSFTCSTSICTSLRLSRRGGGRQSGKAWLFSCSFSSPGVQSGHTLPSLPLSSCPKTQKSDSSSESLSCLHPLTPPLPSSLSPSRVKMKTTVSISARDGRMEVKKSSWEKEKCGPWGRERGESPSHGKLQHIDLKTKEALRGHLMQSFYLQM